jgi:transcriptional regulator GlxA family with amidase domain
MLYMKIDILGFDNCLASAVTGMIDVFRTANTLAKKQIIDWNLICAGYATFETSCGIRMAARQATARQANWLLVPGLDHANIEDLMRRLHRLDNSVRYIKRAATSGSIVGASCAGTFLLGQAGVLQQRRATTSWWLAGYLAQRYPQTTVEAAAILVDEGPVVTSGAMTSYFDLALHVVEHIAGTQLRQQCARIMLLDTIRTSQAAYATRLEGITTRTPLMHKAEQWLHKHLAQPGLTLKALAQHCCVSERTLLRHFRQALRSTPEQHLRQLRIDHAKYLLEITALSTEHIATRCGYSDTPAFRKAFLNVCGITTAQYRRRFNLIHQAYKN